MLTKVLGLLGFFLASLGTIVLSHAYEDELQTLADKLVLQLEKAGQINGTVLDFTDLQGQSNELGRFLAQELSDKLVTAATSISFLDRAGLQYLIRENKLTAEGLVNPETTKKLGNLIGIDTLIIGTATVIGDNIRVSVRALAVETGKIVASQAITLNGQGELADLFPIGVPSSPTIVNTHNDPSSSGNLARFRADTIKLIAKEALRIDSYFYSAGAAFTIVNQSGIGIRLAILRGSTTLGSCEIESLDGLEDLDTDDINAIEYSPDLMENFSYLPPGGSLTASAKFDDDNCPIEKMTSASLSTSVIIDTGQERFVLPLSAGEIPIR